MVEDYRPSRRRIFLPRNRSSCAAEQVNNGASLEAVELSIGSQRRFSRQLTARWSTATGVLMSASSIRRPLLHHGLRASMPLYRIPLTANHRCLRLQWVHEHRAWRADWHQVVFSDDSSLNLWNHDVAAFMLDAMPVNIAF
ncbi:transposable element Tcb2 transposase [Trichonephila clavipes]|nr:transposable element Tcb2 transposase [Trichonephila clavipes]